MTGAAGRDPFVRATAAAFGARRSSHSLVVIGWPVSGLSPIAAK